MHYLREAILHYCKLIPNIVSENNWNTKEDTGKSVMHASTAVGKKAYTSVQSDVEQ